MDVKEIGHFKTECPHLKKFNKKHPFKKNSMMALGTTQITQAQKQRKKKQIYIW